MSEKDLSEMMNKSLRQFHDFLWHEGALKEDTPVQANLIQAAAALDRTAGFNGRLIEEVQFVDLGLKREPRFERLFDTVASLWELYQGVQKANRGDHEAVARHSLRAIEGGLVHLAASLEHFDWVVAQQEGKSSFKDYSSRIADALEEKGVASAGIYKRLVNSLYENHTQWKGHVPPAAARAAAAFALTTAIWVMALYVEILKKIDRYADHPYACLVPLSGQLLGQIKW